MTAGPPISISFGRYQEEAVLFNRIMPCKPFCTMFGWLRAATQYHLAPMCTTLPTSGWLTCRIPWQQLSHPGDTRAVPPQRLTKLHGKELCHSGFLGHLSDGLRTAAQHAGTGGTMMYARSTEALKRPTNLKHWILRKITSGVALMKHEHTKISLLGFSIKLCHRRQTTQPLNEFPAAALPAAALPAGSWLTYHIPWQLGQEQPLQSFEAAPPNFNSMGGGTKTMFFTRMKWFADHCTNACRRLVNLLYLLTSPAPSGGYPASCYSVVALSNHGQGKFLSLTSAH